MNKNIERGELTATFTFAVALLVALLATWVSGCGAPSAEPPSYCDLYPDAAICFPAYCEDNPDEVGCSPRGNAVVEVSCDEVVEGAPRCFYTAHGADSVEVFYDGAFAWGDYGITENRVVYIDGPDASVVAVEACDEVGCRVAVEMLR